MECIAFTRTCLPCARVTMVCMHVSLIELPFQTVMRRIPALKYMLSSARGLLQPRSISSGNDCYRPRGLDADRAYSITEAPGWGDQMPGSLPGRGRRGMSYPIFMPKPSTHRMYNQGSIVPHIRPKRFTYNKMPRIKYNYYISNVSKDYDDSQWIRTAEDSMNPQEWQPGQHVI
jgi:hypothetical protein